jgi:hypothetical protein
MVNDLGVDPDEWFDTPQKEEEYITDEYARCDVEYPAELMEVPTSVENPKPKKDEKTMHQKMYEIATAKYNPFAVGGSEQLGGGSEEVQK